MVRAAQSTTKRAPPNSVSEVIFEVTSRHSSTASSSNRQTTSRQGNASLVQPQSTRLFL